MIKLNVPFLSQMDNVNAPSGTCNLTCLAMGLRYFGIVGDGNGQLEDQLFRRAAKLVLSRHSPLDMAELYETYPGRKDDFNFTGTIQEAKAHLADKKPCIIHGYFTSYGHIIVLTGYDQNGFFVNDPYGEWFRSGYRTDKSGAGLHYSYKMIKELAMADGNLWLHKLA